MGKKLIRSFLFGALCVLAISCAHEPEMTTAEDGSASAADAPPALTADDGAKGALESETKQMLTQEPATTVADASAADNAQGAEAASSSNTDASVQAAPEASSTPLVDPLASMNASPEANATAAPEASEAAATDTTTTVAQAETAVQASAPAPEVNKPRHHRKHAAKKLNRYYFLRTGDTPEFLSKLFYETPDRAEQLVAWNQPRESWQAGKIIYYKSAVKPADRKMLSFYEEKEVAPETYVTKAGDSLAKLAEEKYGSALSAVEIAAVNDLHTDDALPVGKELKLYPAPLGGEANPAVKPEVAKSDSEMIKAEIQKVENDTAKTAPVSPQVATSAPMPIPQPVVPDKQANLASMEVTSFARQNPIVIAGLGALLVLLGSYFVAARKRTRSRLDF